MSAWWVVYAAGVVAIAVSEAQLARAVSTRGVTRWGLVRPPWGAVALRMVGVAAVMWVALTQTASLLWALVALAVAWVPAVVTVMVQRRRRRGGGSEPAA